MLSSDPHPRYLKCLWEAHISDRCSISKDFKPCSRKDRAARLKYLLLESALHPPSEPSTLQNDLPCRTIYQVPSTSVSFNSAPPTLLVWRGRLVLLVPKKGHGKLDSVLRSSRKGNRLSSSKDSGVRSKRRHFQCVPLSRGVC